MGGRVSAGVFVVASLPLTPGPASARARDRFQDAAFPTPARPPPSAPLTSLGVPARERRRRGRALGRRRDAEQLADCVQRRQGGGGGGRALAPCRRLLRRRRLGRARRRHRRARPGRWQHARGAEAREALDEERQRDRARRRHAVRAEGAAEGAKAKAKAKAKDGGREREGGQSCPRSRARSPARPFARSPAHPLARSRAHPAASPV